MNTNTCILQYIPLKFYLNTNFDTGEMYKISIMYYICYSNKHLHFLMLWKCTEKFDVYWKSVLLTESQEHMSHC